MVSKRQDTVLILCDTVTVDRQDGRATFDFGQRSWGSKARFTGEWIDGKLSVSAMAIGGGSEVAATGTCQIAYRSDRSASVIACLARGGIRSFAVNFVPSRL